MEVIYSIFVPLFDYDYSTVFSTVKPRVLKICEQSCHNLLTYPIKASTHRKREPDLHPAPSKESLCLSNNDPADGTDLKLRLLVRHIIEIREIMNSSLCGCPIARKSSSCAGQLYKAFSLFSYAFSCDT